MESFEKIINNCDVLEVIFGYLDFKEHLKLIKICPQFEYAILHGVWRFKCKNLYILPGGPKTFLLKYNSVNNAMAERSLTSKAIHTILHHSSMYIHKLELKFIRCIKNIISLKYRNLTELAFCGTVVENTHLQQVAENCLNLQSLSLINFKSSKREANIRANVFGEMKALNKLEIDDRNFTAWNTFDVQQLFCLARLKTLLINIDVSNSEDNYGNINNSTDRVFNIENLTIGPLYKLPENLICFKNLTKLSILMCAVSIDEIVLTQIDHACPKLCELSFAGCSFEFEEFPHMNNLMHLTFTPYADISLKHFDEIFRKLKIKSLSLGDVLVRDIEDITNYNYISNTLDTLTIQVIVDGEFVRTFFNQQHKFKNVSKISLFNNSSQPIGLYFSHNFPNLRELITNSFSFSSEDILHLKHLKVLQFSLFDDMSWSYLEILFKHPTLTHITITPSLLTNFKMHYERLPNCCESLTTRLEYLSLPFVVYKSVSYFWPSFRQRNKLLKLEIADRFRRTGPALMTPPIQYYYWRLWSKFVN